MNNTPDSNKYAGIYPVKTTIAITNIHPRRHVDGHNRSRTGGFIAWPDVEKREAKAGFEEHKKG